MKKVNLREIRKDYPNMPDCCQRCQAFLYTPLYREGQSPPEVLGKGNKYIVDSPTELPDIPDGFDRVCAVQCPFPSEWLTKDGKIPRKYLQYCSGFLEEELDGAEIIVTEGVSAREVTEKVLDIDSTRDVIHLQYKSGEPNPHAQTRVDWVREKPFVKPEVVDFSTFMSYGVVESDLPISIGLDFEWNPDQMDKPHTVGLAVGDACTYTHVDSLAKGVLRKLVSNPSITIVGHDLARAEIQRLFDLGIHDIKCKFNDSMITTWELMDRAGNVALKELCYKHLPIENYWYNITDEDYKQYSEKTGVYCAKDAWASLYYLRELRKAYSVEAEGMKEAHDLDMQMLLPAAYAMWKGIGVDTDNVRRRIETCQSHLSQYQGKYPINLGSPEQVVDYLNTEFKLKVNSSAEKLLAAIKDNTNDTRVYEFIDDLLEYRSYNKTLGTMKGELLTGLDPNGRIHTYWKTAFANTGRPSYAHPNIANIPVPLRDIICSTHEGGQLGTWDRGASEFRCMAYLGSVKPLIEAFINGVDMHGHIANQIGIDRKPCKNLNFAYIYWGQDAALDAILRVDAGITDDNLLVATREKFKGVMADMREWQEWFIEKCLKLGYVSSPLGRRGYRLKPTNIVNFPVQSWSADLNKMTLLHFFNHMRKRGLQSHIWCEFYDGTEIDIAPGELEEIREIASTAFDVLPDVLNRNIHIPFPLEEKLHGKWWGGD